MEVVIEYLSKLDISTLFAIAAMFWIFKNYLDKKFEKIEGKFEKIYEEFEKIEGKFEKRFTSIEADMREIRGDIREIRKDISRIDREVGVITATLRFNGFDLDRHKVEGE